MKKVNILLLIFCFTFFTQLCYAQTPLIDSLLTELTKLQEVCPEPCPADTTKVNVLNALASEMIYKSKLNNASEYSFKAYSLSKKINYQKGEADAIYRIGLVSWIQGNYPESLKKYFASLKINQAIGNKTGVAECNNVLGLVYVQTHEYNEALKYFLAAYKLNNELGNTFAAARNYSNIGLVYKEQGKYSEALKYYIVSLKTFEEFGDKRSIAVLINSIGLVYSLQGNYAEALKIYIKSLETFKEIDNKRGIANTYNLIGNVYMSKGSYALANKYMLDALTLSKLIGSKEYIKESYYNLMKLDSLKGNWKSAFNYNKLFILYRDSISNEKTMQEKMNYEFEKKEADIRAEQDKKDAIAKEEVKRERNIRNFSFGGIASLMLFSIIVIRQRNKVKKEKKRSDELLLNILPIEVANELKQTGETEARQYNNVTVLFTDFKNFTSMSENLSAKELVGEINYCYSAFDNIITKYGIEKIKTIGDSYMCAGGLPVANDTHAIDVVNAAIEIRNFIELEKQKRIAEHKPYFEIRIGCNTGPVVAGIVGIKKFAYDIWGDTVNIASRMESSGEPGKINISGSTYELVKANFMCEHRGKIEAKNKGEIDMYFVNSINI